MKKLLLFSALLLSISLFAQTSTKITAKKCIPKKGYHLKLKNVLSDSRCPQETTCVWAGEVSVLVQVYKDKKFIEEKTVTFNSKNSEENIQWFTTYYSKKIKKISFGPAKKEGVVVAVKNQYITITTND